MRKFFGYFRYVWKTRYFWLHLTRNDLISRNRRSKLGLLWLMIQPLIMTAILATVFGTIFNRDITEFAPYVYIGTTIWELLTSSIIGGSGAFQSAAQYIKQFNHRVTIYSLRTALVTTINFLIAEIGIFLWIAIIKPQNLLVGLLTFPLTVVLLFMISWVFTTISAFIHVKYRDYQRVVQIIMQALWYFSPVFIEEDIFQRTPWQRVVYNLNPFTHVLSLQRKPLLHGILPSSEDFLFTIGLITAFGIVAWCINRRYEKSFIFYI